MKPIGSDFHLPLGILAARKKKNLPMKQTYLASGRACLKAVIVVEHPKTVLLPAYLCDSVLMPFKEKNIKMVFYRVTNQLGIDETDLFAKIKKEKPDMIVIIHYFGWIQPAVEKILQRIRKLHQACIIVEDIVQSYLTTYQPSGDYWFNSYRKFLPVADGAFVGGKKMIQQPKETASSGVRKIALLLKKVPGMNKAARKLFKTYEHNKVNKGVQAMSGFSRRIVEWVDETAVKKIRRRNYQYLATRLGQETDIRLLFPNLPEGVCPLGLPVMVKNREEVCATLINQKIYCPVHWELPADISKKEFPVSHEISTHILTIPIDQRYTEKDMERIVQCLKK